MSDANASSSPLPPAPPSSFGRKGCLKFVLIGCGALVVLFIVLIVVTGLWFNRNQDVFEGGVQEGARFGLVRDEAACLQEAQRRAAESTTMAGTVGVGPFLRSCLEYSRPTAGFCDNVPPPTAIGRTAAWQSHRCGDNGHCRAVIPVVQTYCIDGRSKRTAADTLLMDAGGDGGAGGAQGGGTTGGGAQPVDPGAAGADSASF